MPELNRRNAERLLHQLDALKSIRAGIVLWKASLKRYEQVLEEEQSFIRKSIRTLCAVSEDRIARRDSARSFIKNVCLILKALKLAYKLHQRGLMDICGRPTKTPYMILPVHRVYSDSTIINTIVENSFFKKKTDA